MRRSTIPLTLIGTSAVAAVLSSFASAFGWQGWVPVLFAVSIGFLIAWPAAYALQQALRRHDRGARAAERRDDRDRSSGQGSFRG